MATIKYLSIIVLFCLLCSCRYQTNRKNEQKLTNAARLVGNAPDSAMLILDSVNTEQLSEQQFARFVIFRIRAKERRGLDISGDTIAIQAKNYLVKKKDKEAAFACFVVAKVYEFQGKFTEAFKNYKEAERLTENSTDYLLRGDIQYNIARINYIHKLYNQSVSSLQKVREYNDLAKCNYKYIIYTEELTGFNYLYLNKVDSALHYFDIALNIAVKHNDIIQQRRILQNMAITFCKAKEFDTAKKTCLQAIALTSQTDSIRIGQLYSTLASVYNFQEQIDSASVYAYKAKAFLKKSDNHLDRAYLYEVLASVEQKKGNVAIALLYSENQHIQLDNLKILKRAVLDVQTKDELFQRLQKERDKLAQSKKESRLVNILLSLVLSIMAIFYLFRRIRKKDKAKFQEYQEKSRQKLQESKEEFQEIIEESETEKEEMKAAFEQEISDIIKLFSEEQMKIVFQINSTAILDEILHDKDVHKNYRKAHTKINEMLKKANWDAMYPGLSKAHNGLIDRLKSDFPILNEKEYKIFALSCSGYSVMGIAKILGYANNTIQSKQTDIRKIVGIPLSGSFTEFVSQQYGITVIEKKQDN